MRGSPLRLLLVEDSAADAKLVLHELRQAGFDPTFTLVDTEADFLTALKDPHDVVLCDYSMPQFDALRALELLRKHRPDVPFLIVSGLIGEETAVEAIKRGATDYLIKDRLIRLGAAVQQALDQGKLREAEARAQQSLRASEMQYRTLADSIPQIVWTAGPDGGIEYLNRQALNYAGLCLDDLSGWAWERVVHPDDLSHTAVVWGGALRTGEPRDFDFRLRRADGEYRWHITRQVAVRDAAGGVVRWFGTCTDIHDQKAATEAQARDALLLASVRDSVVVTDLRGMVTYWNDGANRLFGWTAVEMLGRSYADRFPEPARTEIANHILQRAEGANWSGEYEDYRKDGSRVWIDVRMCPIADACGRPAGVMAVAHDITDRKGAEAERDHLLERLRTQIERMPLAYLLSGPDLRYTQWNPAAERMFGFAEAEVLGKHPFDAIVPPESRPAVADVFARLKAGDMNAHGACENVTRDGRRIICDWSNTPLRGDDGTFHGLLSLAQDITARHEAEKSLELRDRAIRAATQGLIITDPTQTDNPIIYASPAFEHLTGYTAEEALGRNCRFLQGQDTAPAAATQVREAVRAGRPCSVELLNYRKDGTTFWNSLSVSPVQDVDGRLTHFVGVQTDVTERKQLEEQFRQAQKMEAIGVLAGGVAHDFNNLLTVINGYSELLLTRLPAGDGRAPFVTAIREAGERAAGLTAQLLAFSRKTITTPKVLDLNAVVDDIGRMLRRLIGEDVRLEVAPGPRLCRVMADLGQMEQVILNLAVNARDAMPTGGRLAIETANDVIGDTNAGRYPGCPPGQYVRLSVSDTGHGMTNEVKARIFEPFFTTKGVGKGTGLGLATVYGIVAQAGGHIAVESQVGRGTSFTVLLPATAVAPEADTAVAHPPACGTETILLVEDEDAVRRLAGLALGTHGYRVLEAAGGGDAVRWADEHPGPIHLLVTDVVMPEMDGREVAEAVRRRRPGLPVLFLSGYTDDAVVRHGVSQTADMFLQKPFAPLALARKVREVLDRAG